MSTAKAKACCKLVAYRRTSTDDQKLGIHAQDLTIKRIAEDRGCDIVRVFTEHESGGNDERPELDKAIRYARRVNAALVVAKLDRLARDNKFLMKLYDGNVPVLFGDLPEVDGSAASRLMIQMMSIIAEFERKRIGERTKEALGVLKAQGVQLGTPANLTQPGRIRGARKAGKNRVARAVDEMSDVEAIARPMKEQGHSLRQIAAYLDGEGYLTRNGASWNAVQIKRILDRGAATR